MKRKVLGLFTVVVLASTPAMAASLALGNITFLITNDTENGFSLNNLTGDCGGSVGVCSPVVLQNVVVSITPSGGSAFDVNMGDLQANSTTFSSALSFPNSEQFDLVTLSGTASLTSILLASGDTFQASADQVFATLSFPSLGATAPILIQGDVTSPVPEPASLGLVGSGMLALTWIARRRRRLALIG